ncbi:MAG TPA: DUF6288 domain-containing protein [Opitutales bacterium]|nr:DUF6288 domain-containing protein [Opitutales bacterium]
MHNLRFSLRRLLLSLFVFQAIASSVLAQDSYFAEPPIFAPHPVPDSRKAWNVKNFGPVGIGIDIKAPGMTMVIMNVEAGSPADQTGQLKKGQVIERINGQMLEDRDPRMILGDLITEAEATDGKIRLKIKGEGEVTVPIPVMGRYSENWPVNCPKSDKIVRQLADLHGTFEKPKWGSILFLLSTGEEKDLEVVKRWVGELEGGEKMHWEIGFSGPGLCEYYLRTGDERVLPVIKDMADTLKKNMYNGGWSGRGAPASFSYSTGTGQVHASGMPCVTFLLMARLCGVEVDEYTLQESLKAFYRFSGKGNVPYGDGLPEGGFRDNGKTSSLALAMNAATLLTPEGENSVYANARDVSAMKAFYATNWFHAAHTGGGMGEIWHHAAMHLMREKRPVPYRSYFDTRRWVMDLSRRFDGSIGIAGMTDRYDASATDVGHDRDWGTLFALTYTLPRKQLQLFGAPRSQWAKHHPLPARPWGTPRDDVFQSPEPIHIGASIRLTRNDLLNESVLTDASLPVIRKINAVTTEEELFKYIIHPEYGFRVLAMRRLVDSGWDHLVLPMLESGDPRLRQAGLLAITGMFKGGSIPDSSLTPEMFERIGGMIEDEGESWWVLHSAVNALERAPTSTIGQHRDRLLELLYYDSTWIRMETVDTLAKISAEPEHYKIVLPKVIKVTTEFTNDKASGRSSKAIREALESADKEVQTFADPLVKAAYASIPEELVAHHGAVLGDGAKVVKSRIGSILQELPNGSEFLKRLPKETRLSAISGQASDQYVYRRFEPNPEMIGKWRYLTRKYENSLDDQLMLSDEQITSAAERAYEMFKKKKERGRRVRANYMTLKEGGQVDRSKSTFWSGDLLVSNNDAEARKMVIRKIDGDDYLLLEKADFASMIEKENEHTGYDIYIREE